MWLVLLFIIRVTISVIMVVDALTVRIGIFVIVLTDLQVQTVASVSRTRFIQVFFMPIYVYKRKRKRIGSK